MLSVDFIITAYGVSEALIEPRSPRAMLWASTHMLASHRVGNAAIAPVEALEHFLELISDDNLNAFSTFTA